MKLPPIERIEWQDAQHPAGEWVAAADLKGVLPVIYSVGYRVFEDRAKVVLAAAWDGENATAEITIPKAMVVRRKLMR